MLACLLRRLALAVLFGLLAGCERDPAAFVEPAKQRLELQRELVEVLKTVHDKASMATARERLRQLDQRAEALQARMRALAEPSAAMRERLEREVGGPLRETQAAQQEEVARILGLPGGDAFFEGLRGSAAVPAADEAPGRRP